MQEKIKHLEERLKSSQKCSTCGRCIKTSYKTRKGMGFAVISLRSEMLFENSQTARCKSTMWLTRKLREKSRPAMYSATFNRLLVKPLFLGHYVLYRQASVVDA